MKDEKVVIIGAGKSGRGYIGELYDLEGYKITYADRDKELIEKLKAQKEYTVYKYSEDGKEEIRKISGYRALHTIDEHSQYIDAIVNADYVSTATYPDGFDAIVEDIVEAVRKRMKLNIEKPMAITLGANYVGLWDYFNNKLSKKLNDDELQYFNKYVGLVESIIYRASSYPTAEQKANDPLAVQGDDWNYLKVERKAFVFPKEHKLPQFFLPEDDITKQITLKIWIGNTLHCSYAFLGHYYKLDYTYQAARHNFVSKNAYYASNEGYVALAKKYNMPIPRPNDEEKEIWDYYGNPAILDSLLRVAADPIRKLGRNDRFIGPALLSMEMGDIPFFICQNAAYGFVYKNEDDPSAVKLNNLINNQGIEKTIIDVCGLDITKQNEYIIYQLILKNYKKIVDYNPAAKYIDITL